MRAVSGSPFKRPVAHRREDTGGREQIHSKVFASLGGELIGTLVTRWERCILRISFGKDEEDEGVA